MNKEEWLRLYLQEVERIVKKGYTGKLTLNVFRSGVSDLELKETIKLNERGERC